MLRTIYDNEISKEMRLECFNVNMGCINVYMCICLFKHVNTCIILCYKA